MPVLPVSLDCCSQTEAVWNALRAHCKKFGVLLRLAISADWPSAVLQFELTAEVEVLKMFR
jgi:hypothetical protein